MITHLLDDIFIPEGCHDVEDMNEYIQQEMREMATTKKQAIRFTLKYQLIQSIKVWNCYQE